MTREEIKAIFAEATDEQLNKVMALYGAGIEKHKGEAAALKAELKEKKDALENLGSEFEMLKANNAAAEDYKEKLEALQRDVAEKEKAAREHAEQEEKRASALRRYEAASVDKNGNPLKWSHDAIKADYFNKFLKALSDKEYEGRSDLEIFNALTKDDAEAFKIPTAEVVTDGAARVTGGETDDARINAIMGLN